MGLVCEVKTLIKREGLLLYFSDLYSEGVCPVSFLKTVLNEDFEL